ncbi:MAG: hypothetical protein ABI321_24775 [Polyangia bacterium]
MALASLLRARRFRAAGGADRVAANLLAGGAQLAPDAPAWIGTGSPPVDAPSLSLGPSPGALGPFSWGFLNHSDPQRGAIVALDTPPVALPRAGRLGVVVPRRDALPDVLPLLAARELGVSWIISVGDGDPADAIEFLSEDAATDALAIVLGDGARAAGLRTTLGAKPTVVLGGDAMARAVARRAGAHVVERIGEWLALATWLAADVPAEAPVEVWVKGGGASWVRAEMERYGLQLTTIELDDRDASAAKAALAACTGPRAIVLVGADLQSLVPADPAVRLVLADTRQPEQVSRLFKALAAERAQLAAAGDTAPRIPVDAQLVARVREESEGTLSDHDAKRLLKAWGVKVTRQGPTGTPTGAVKLARLIGMPVVLARGDEERVVDTIPEIRRVAALLLELESDEPQSVMVRERFADAPRARLKTLVERGVGLTMRIGDAVALLPLESSEAIRLAQHSGARRAADQRVVAGVLTLIGAAALSESATLDLELFTGAEPTVLRASGSLKKP